ncbi:hypothetical protein SDC9_159110 [bioreactor metagenome]|uniref:Uncharacterized protein n=1 Tax=bioreactor metagenome TaxID=1076179 RepID=A0A645FEA7_9ZZZZ
MLHRALIVAYLYPVVYIVLVLHDYQHAVDKVAYEVLRREGDAQSGDADTGEDGFYIDADGAEYHEAHHRGEQHAQHLGRELPQRGHAVHQPGAAYLVVFIDGIPRAFAGGPKNMRHEVGNGLIQKVPDEEDKKDKKYRRHVLQKKFKEHFSLVFKKLSVVAGDSIHKVFSSSILFNLFSPSIL